MYIENSRYLDIVTISCKQIHKGKRRKLFKKFFLGYYEKKKVVLDQQGVKGRGEFSNLTLRTIPLKDILKTFNAFKNKQQKFMK